MEHVAIIRAPARGICVLGSCAKKDDVAKIGSRESLAGPGKHRRHHKSMLVLVQCWLSSTSNRFPPWLLAASGYPRTCCLSEDVVVVGEHMGQMASC